MRSSVIDTDLDQSFSVVVLASGAGTLCAAVRDAAVAGAPFDVTAVVSDRDCAAVAEAASAGLETAIVRPRDYSDRAAWDSALADTLAALAPDLVVSAGFMRIVGSAVLDTLGGRIINTHPALLPAFPGAHAVEDALAYGVTITGATVHLVDIGVDTGPILAQHPVPVESDDTVASLHDRIKGVERRLLVEVIERCAHHGNPSSLLRTLKGTQHD